ncbi:hypothetical protein N7456_004886 [Penicillium angulare]|uniref:Arylsulfatase n=1 Tax=Penicillium angulare TaxID=116970 RepID=A0A9W9KJL9_9EURO|nr:hypothetical protein N7456_004886 [Penicillium angulare]
MKLLATIAGLAVTVEGAIIENGFNVQNVQNVLQSALSMTSRPTSKPPNFLFVITDDQDLQLDSTSYTPHILRHVRDKGTSFHNHFVTTALCCPSRVSLWTGRQPHNTNVTDVNPPYGGYPKFVDRGFNDNFLPIWLQEAGYDTYYTGKLFNAHTVDNYHSPHVNGFNGSDFLLDPYTYSYLNSTYQRNHDDPVSYEGEHTTDVITRKALGFLEDALEGDRPFFVTVAPAAPHSNVDPTSIVDRKKGITMSAPIPLDRHKHLFQDVKVPRTANFNPDEPSGASWIRELPQQNQTVVDYGDFFYQSRLQALQGVDELVDTLVTRLEESDQLDNTYIIYTSDNGFHIGQHRLPPGKTCGFEEDIRVPLFIRGPGVPKGFAQDSVTTHIDLAPTIFQLAGIPHRSDFDGTAIPVTPDFTGTRHEHVTVEYWGRGVLEGDFSHIIGGSTFAPNNTYKSIRLLGPGYNLYYSVWCTNEHELYDLSTDPYQLHNLYPSESRNIQDEPRILGRSLSQAISRLDTLLLILKSCQGNTCIEPWKVLHPEGSIHTLRDALDEQHDIFYDQQPQVSFNWCDLGYRIEAEGPQDHLTTRYGLSWDSWV